jgi:hypothetical protein
MASDLIWTPFQLRLFVATGLTVERCSSLGEVFAPIPRFGVVAASDGLVCAYTFGDLVVETRDLLA